MGMGIALVMLAMWTALRGVGQFIYDYQTLLTGAGALVAAYIAAKPVWKQLKLTQTQSNGVLREMLLARRVEVKKARASLAEHVEKHLSELNTAVYWPDGEPNQLDEHQAHHHDQSIWRAANWLQSESKERDSGNVEA